MIKTLNELKTGEEGTLVFEKVAPLGDPLELKVKGYAVCLRKEEAKFIKVEV